LGERALAALRRGGKPALARALAAIEAAPQADATIALLDLAYAAPRAQVIGLTGPPGVGKSTLIGRLIQAWRAGGESVGVIAVDPSSRRSGGALLGDRLRFDADPEDDGLFVRSMAARERLGGLAELTVPAMVLMRTLFERVVVETVGIGQSETEIAGVADTIVLAIQPASGDSLQYLKAGIAELPDIVVVAKADLGKPAERAVRDIKAALPAMVGGQAGWTVPVLAVSAQDGQGLDALMAALAAHAAHLAGGALAARRAAQAERWLAAAVLAEHGRAGLARAGAVPGGLAHGGRPFHHLASLLAALARAD
jgi:LAO/AO transport system kinase